MPTMQQREQNKDFEQHKRATLNALIAEQLLHTLGEPGDLLQVQVRLIWENRYRVNVLVGENAASAKVANSYFLLADANGNILESTPNITRKYGTRHKGVTNVATEEKPI
jgi:hypothetical protein